MHRIRGIDRALTVLEGILFAAALQDAMKTEFGPKRELGIPSED